MDLAPWQWCAATAAALIVGMSKAGITGGGMLAVVIFAEVMPAKQATGVMLPMLILGDLIGVRLYHAHAQWRHLLRLFPWTAVGVVSGYFALGRISETGARILIGVIVLVLVATQAMRRRSADGGGRKTEGGGQGACLPVVAPVTGIVAGFTTLIANAAGPFMSIYLLAMRLPKFEFVGTSAVFFLLINVFKVPFMMDLRLIHGESLGLNLMLAPAVIFGAWLGWKLLPRIRQGLFESLVLSLSALAGLDLCVRTLWTLMR